MVASSTKKYLQTRLNFSAAPAAPAAPDYKGKRGEATETQDGGCAPKKARKGKENVNNTEKQIKTPGKPKTKKISLATTLKATVERKSKKSRTRASPAFIKHSLLQPPKFTEILLIYSEDEIWTRLQIREFAFRFGDHFELDSRTIASLQNLQGNWRIKRLSTSLAWKLITSMEAGLIELPILQRSGALIVHEWMEDRGLVNNKYLTGDAARIAFAEGLDREGLSVQHWQDIVDVLDSAGFRNIPQPGGRKLEMVDELIVVRMMCDLLMHHQTLRKQWIADRGTSSKDLMLIEAKLKAVRFKDNDTNERLAMERQNVELITSVNKSARRLEAAGRDSKGNEYWLFNDLATSSGTTDSRNSEPFWGHGVIVVGPGVDATNNGSARWWHVSEISDIVQLRRWLETEARTDSTVSLCSALTQRAQYLRSLEWIDAHKSSRKLLRT